MGLFGFGKKKHQSKEALEAAAGENEEAVDAAENVDEAQEVVALPERSRLRRVPRYGIILSAVPEGH